MSEKMKPVFIAHEGRTIFDTEEEATANNRYLAAVEAFEKAWDELRMTKFRTFKTADGVLLGDENTETLWRWEFYLIRGEFSVFTPQLMRVTLYPGNLSHFQVEDNDVKIGYRIYTGTLSSANGEVIEFRLSQLYKDKKLAGARLIEICRENIDRLTARIADLEAGKID